MNTKKLGDVGLGQAIAYFTSLGMTVSIPLTDSQEYDLIVDNGKPRTVQIKRTSFKRNGKFYVSLTTKGGNRTSIGKIKKLNKEKVDLLFIVTSEFEIYIIPTWELEVNHSITLDEDYAKFKVNWQSGQLHLTVDQTG
jgi:PD-(D/E)XK nuclease superfamily protein